MRKWAPGRRLLLCAVVAISIFMAAPLIWMLVCSVRPDAEIRAAPFGLPVRWRWDQWAAAWREGSLARCGWNSVVVTIFTVTATIALAAPAAWALARSRGGGSRGIAFYLLGLIVPSQAAVVPTFLLLRTLHLLDTWWALVLPYTAWSLPLAVFVFHGFFAAMSTEPEDAARIDGCGPGALFRRVALPLAAPATGVVAVITALGAWNEFLFALLYVHSDSARTLPLGLLAFSSAHTTDYGLTFAALAIASLPLLVAYGFIQRSLIEGSAGVFG